MRSVRHVYNLGLSKNDFFLDKLLKRFQSVCPRNFGRGLFSLSKKGRFHHVSVCIDLFDEYLLSNLGNSRSLNQPRSSMI